MKATIALDRSSGAILKTAGQISLLRPASSQQAQPQSPSTAIQQQQEEPSAESSSNNNSNPGASSETQGAEELAGMVWGFVNAAGGLVEGLDTEVSSCLLSAALFRLLCNFVFSKQTFLRASYLLVWIPVMILWSILRGRTSKHALTYCAGIIWQTTMRRMNLNCYVYEQRSKNSLLCLTPSIS